MAEGKQLTMKEYPPHVIVRYNQFEFLWFRDNDGRVRHYNYLYTKEQIYPELFRKVKIRKK